MGRNYFENPSCNVAFERCIDVLAELIEKYAGKLQIATANGLFCGAKRTRSEASGHLLGRIG